MMDMASDLIQRRSEPFDASKFKNHYSEALKELVKRKVSKGQSVAVEENQEPTSKVIDFMEALKKSVADKGNTSKPAEAKTRSTTQKSKSPNVKAKRTKTA